MLPAKLLTQLEKHFIEIENSNIQKTNNSITYREIAEISVESPDKNIKVKLVISEGNLLSEHGEIISTTDDEILISLPNTFFEAISRDSNGYTHLFCIIAHEIGHLLSGHFELEEKKNWLSHNTEDQIFFYKSMVSSETEKEKNTHYKNYMSATLKSLLKGGYDIKEMEADKIALKFVDINDLMALHILTLSKNNVFCRIEKINRIKRLQKEEGKNPTNRDGYSLNVVFKSEIEPEPSTGLKITTF